MLYNYSILKIYKDSIHNPWGAGKSKSLILTDQEREDYIKQLKTILSQPKNLNFGKAVYTGNLSNIPRFKFKEYITTNKIKRTSRQEQCDSMIIDKTFLITTLRFFEKLTKSNLIRNIQDEEIYNGFIKCWQKNYHRNENVKFTQQNTLIKISCDINDISDKNLKHLVQNSHIEQKYFDLLYREKNIENVIMLLDFLRKCPNINVIFDEHLLETLNADGLDLDHEYVDILENMFKSGQNDNIKLAIEMLSNINLNEKNALTIALILNKYQDIFTHGSGVTPSSMSSFKTIDKYYKSRGIVWKTNWTKFSAGLYSNYQHDPETKQIVEQFIMDHINGLLNVHKLHINSFDLAFQD
jgi:hypothetical protein